MLALGLTASAHASITIEGLRLQSSTRGTVTREASAAFAELGEDRRQIIARDLVLNVTVGTTETMTTAAPRAILMIGDGQPTAEDATPDLDQVRHYADEFGQQASKGDFLLQGLDKPIDVLFGTRGSISAEQMIWSVRYNRMIVPRPFRQVLEVGGAELILEGDGLMVDQEFREWNYLVEPGNESTLTYENHTPVDPAEDAP